MNILNAIGLALGGVGGAAFGAGLAPPTNLTAFIGGAIMVVIAIPLLKCGCSNPEPREESEKK